MNEEQINLNDEKSTSTIDTNSEEIEEKNIQNIIDDNEDKLDKQTDKQNSLNDLQSLENSENDITYKLPNLEAVFIDKSKVNNVLNSNEIYYIVYSDTCVMCQILLKYISKIKFNYKLIHFKDLLEMAPNSNIISVPYIINSKKEKININSLLEILKEHNIKTLK
jgi:hypothetical protein